VHFSQEASSSECHSTFTPPFSTRPWLPEARSWSRRQHGKFC